MSGRPVRRFVDGLLRGPAHRTGTPGRRRSPGDEDGHRVARRPHGQRLAARGVRHRPAPPAGRSRWMTTSTADDGASDGGRRAPVGRWSSAPGLRRLRRPPGSSWAATCWPRRAPRRGVATRRRACSNRTPARGMRSARVPTCPRAARCRSISARSTGSCTAPTHKVEAVSGICTHQGCKLWLDAPDSRLRCPCHSTSFSLEGETVTHQLPTRSAAAAEVRGA